MHDFQHMQMLELNICLGLEVKDEGPLAFMSKKYLNPATESNVIVLYNSLQNLSLSS